MTTPDKAGSSVSKKTPRVRLDWMPGDAVLQGLEIARRLFPHLKTQEIVDRVFLTGLYALQQPPWRPPTFEGTDRDRWKLPQGLRLEPQRTSRENNRE